MVRIAFPVLAVIGLLFSGCGGEPVEDLAKKEVELVKKLQDQLASVKTAADAKAKQVEITKVAIELSILRKDKKLKSTLDDATKKAAKAEFDRVSGSAEIKDAFGTSFDKIKSVF